MKNHLIGEAIDVTKEAGNQLKKIVSLVGGVTQDRFFDRYSEIKGILNKYGYVMPQGVHDKLITDLQIRKTQVKDKKNGKDVKTGTYAPEFERLRQYAVARLNYSNPGLGEVFTSVWPAFVMANKGNIKSEPIKDIETLAKTYPAGSYKPTFKEKATAEINTNSKQTTVQQPVTMTLAESNSNLLAMLNPVAPVMEAGLKAAGIVPPNNVQELAEMFYNEIVAKGTNAMNFDSLDEPMTNAILSFIATVKAKADAGEQLNPVYQKIAGVTAKVQEKIESQTKTLAGNSLGNWIIDHPFETALIAIVLFLIARKLFK